VTVQTAVSGRLPSQVETTAYFAVAEALTNIAKHRSRCPARPGGPALLRMELPCPGNR
jgi:hypothetical protein